MSVGERIRQARIASRMKQSDLASAVGVTRSAIGNYESDVSFPRDDTLMKLIGALKVDANFLLMGQDDAQKRTAPRIRDLTSARFPSGPIEETRLVEGFRRLPPSSRAHVISTVDILLNMPYAPRTVDMRVFRDPAAAGRPLYAESDYETLPFPAEDVPNSADFGVRISGDSMSPGIPDGAIVWVHSQNDILSGQVGIFMLGDSAVCKRAQLTESGALRALNSDNMRYSPIVDAHLSGAQCVGRVVGVIE